MHSPTSKVAPTHSEWHGLASVQVVRPCSPLWCPDNRWANGTAAIAASAVGCARTGSALVSLLGDSRPTVAHRARQGTSNGSAAGETVGHDASGAPRKSDGPSSGPAGIAEPGQDSSQLVPHQAGPPAEVPPYLGPSTLAEGPARGFVPPVGQFDDYGLPPIPGPRFGDSPIGGPRHPARPASDHPVSGHPTGRHPASGQPVSGMPVSGHPVSGHPVSGQPVNGMSRQSVSGPPDPIFDTRPSWEPRIVPSPPPRRGRLLVSGLAGLAGLLIFGATGFFVGRSTAPQAVQPPVPRSATPPASTLSPYETVQQAANKPK